MGVTIKYFGVIAEAAGATTETVDLTETGSSVDELRSYCLKKYGAIGDLSFQIAVNQNLNSSEALKDGDEVAFLPPFAGG